MAIGKPEIAIKFVYAGLILVAIGWAIVVRSLLSVRVKERRR
ncbi:MAG: hypothetical protein QXO16_05545 [Archaeoglobaceae archaeon]